MNKLLMSFFFTAMAMPCLIEQTQASQVTPNPSLIVNGIGASNNNPLGAAIAGYNQNFNDLYTRGFNVPLSYGGWFPGENSSSQASGSAQQSAQRHLMYLPHGGTFAKLLFSNTGANQTSGETDAATGILMNIGVEANVPAPWVASTSYPVGSTVTFINAQYVALAASTGVQPGPANTTTWVTQTPIPPKPVTCNGIRSCGTTLQTTASGTSIPSGFFVTDEISINVPATGGWIAVDIFTNQPAVASTVNTLYTGPTTNVLSGEYAGFSTAISDLSLSGVFPIQSYITSVMSPVLIGQPAAPGPGVCLETDSIGAGALGGTSVIAISGYTASGTGFTASDVYRVGTISSVNNGAGVVNTNATVMITGVSGGQVTNVVPVDPGSYSTAASTGPYTVTFPGSVGSGVTIATVALGAGHDIKGLYGTQGSLQRAFADNGIPTVNLSKSGDLLLGYQTRDYTRLAFARASGCSEAVIELSVNDQTGGASAATIIARAQALAAQLKGLGTIKKVLLTTMTPIGVASTDGFTTIAGQTPNAGTVAVHAAYNQAVRAIPAGFDGYIDSSGCVETAQDSDVWKADGATTGLYTIDGIHKTETGIPLAEVCEAGQIKALVASGAIQ